MPGPPIYSTAVAVLDAVVASLAEAGAVAFARSYVSDGQVAYDCEQLAVEVEGVGQGLPGLGDPSTIVNTTSWTAFLAVHAVRCAPPMSATGAAPSATAITASAATIQRDGSAMLDAARDYAAVSCRSVVVSGLNFPGPVGGFAVALARLQVGF